MNRTISHSRLKSRLVISLFSAHLVLCLNTDVVAQNFWQRTNGPNKADLRALAINPSGQIFAASYGGGIFHSTNNGDSWIAVNSGLTNTDVRALAINAANGHIFAGTGSGGIFRSMDNGASWTAQNSGLSNLNISAFAINSRGYIFAGTTGGGIFRSMDNGENWTAVNSSWGVTIFVGALAINSSGDIFIGISSSIYRSRDNGANWTYGAGFFSSVVALAINSSGDIFAGLNNGRVYCSTNNGNNWTDVSSGLPGYSVGALTVNSSDHIFAGTNGGGVYHLTTNGESWTAVNSGLTDLKVGALAINSSGRIFAGTYGGFVFRSVQGVVPSVTTNTATNVSSTSATLNGNVNPNGLSTTVRFEYGTTVGYGSAITATPSPVSGASAVSVSAALTGLSPNTLYHYRVVGTNSAGTATGANQTFTTSAAGSAPTVITNTVTNVSINSATLNGMVTPNGLSTTVKFQYGLTTSYGSDITAAPSPVTGNTAVSVSAGLTGLAPNTLYHYRITGTNSAGTTNGADQTFTTSSVDQSAPQMTHTAVVAVSSGQSQTITATLTDNVGVQSATLFYRQGGASSFTSTAMANISGAAYQGAIPAGFINERGAEYYISAQDAAGNRATFPATNPQTKPQVIQVTNSNLAFANSTPVKAYRMIAVPFDLNDKSPAGILEDDLGRYDDTQWRLLRYVNSAYTEYGSPGFANFSPGTGFWLITREAKTLDAGAGRSVTTAQNYVINLPVGWSQIGNPFAFTVNWSDVIKGANVENRLVGYQGALNEATGYDHNRTQLVPFEGYFVHNLGSNSTTIEIPPKSATGSNLEKEAATVLALETFEGNEWGMQIIASVDRYLDKDNYIGFLNDASDTWDANDFSEAPFFDQHVSLYFPHPEWEKFPGLYTGDFREIKAEGDYWDFVVRSEVAKSEVAKSEVVLKLAEVQNLPADWEVVLLDKASRVAINFSEKRQYSFPSGGGKTVREFRIVVGKKDFVETNNLNLSGVPQDFVLGQNYPNPFNPETRIDYELPITSYVKISIYNLSGQLVRTLFDGEQSAGRYTVSWDGANSVGDRVATGIYFIRMRAGNFVQMRKIALVE